jgi:hypothetical protein
MVQRGGGFESHLLRVTCQRDGALVSDPGHLRAFHLWCSHAGRILLRRHARLVRTVS